MKNLYFLLLLVSITVIGNAQNKPRHIIKEITSSKSTPAVFISLFDGKTLNGWTSVPEHAFTVLDSSIAITGTDRGFIYTNASYTSYRVIFSVRQVKGINHWPCMLIFGYDPKIDAMGAVQFQLPKDYTWDYRPGKNNDGKPFFSFIGQIPNVSKTEWARCEILVDATTGSARNAVSQPLNAQAIEITDFKDANIRNIPTPFGFQSHNKGQYDEFKDIIIQVNPKIPELLTVLPAPTSLHAITKSAKTVKLSWVDNSKVEDGFIVERSVNNIKWTNIYTADANVTYFTDKRLNAKTQYYYRVHAFNTVANSLFASTAVITNK